MEEYNLFFFFCYLEKTLLKKGSYKTLHKKILKLLLFLKKKVIILRINFFIKIFKHIRPFLKLIILKKKRREIQKVKHINKIFGTKLGIRWLLNNLTSQGSRYLLNSLFNELWNVYFIRGFIFKKKFIEYQACIKSRFFKY